MTVDLLGKALLVCFRPDKSGLGSPGVPQVYHGEAAVQTVIPTFAF